MNLLPESWRNQLEFYAATHGIIPQTHKIEARKRLADVKAWSADSAFDHSLWDAVLKKHVRAGGGVIHDGDQIVEDVSLVDYAHLMVDDRFEAYLGLLASVDLESLPPVEQLALLINTYNALCIKLVTKHIALKDSSDPPLRSINELTTKESKVWDLPAGSLGGKTVTLNQVEHEYLRGSWDEPRLHACIVCASASCPNLRAGAFTGEHLEDQMREQMHLFCSNPTKGVLGSEATSRSLRGSGTAQLRLSRIFLWFANDFGGLAGAAEHAVDAARAGSDESATTIAVLPLMPKACRLRYFKYSWLLNAQPGFT